jgi:hypothetical protein
MIALFIFVKVFADDLVIEGFDDELDPFLDRHKRVAALNILIESIGIARLFDKFVLSLRGFAAALPQSLRTGA